MKNYIEIFFRIYLTTIESYYIMIKLFDDADAFKGYMVKLLEVHF